MLFTVGGVGTAENNTANRPGTRNYQLMLVGRWTNSRSSMLAGVRDGCLLSEVHRLLITGMPKCAALSMHT